MQNSENKMKNSWNMMPPVIDKTFVKRFPVLRGSKKNKEFKIVNRWRKSRWGRSRYKRKTIDNKITLSVKDKSHYFLRRPNRFELFHIRIILFKKKKIRLWHGTD